MQVAGLSLASAAVLLTILVAIGSAAESGQQVLRPLYDPVALPVSDSKAPGKSFLYVISTFVIRVSYFLALR